MWSILVSPNGGCLDLIWLYLLSFFSYMYLPNIYKLIFQQKGYNSGNTYNQMDSVKIVFFWSIENCCYIPEIKIICMMEYSLKGYSID